MQVEVYSSADQVRLWMPQDIEFALSDPGVIAGVATGDTKSPEPCQATRRSLFNGRVLVIIRSSGHTGAIQLTANSKDLTATGATINAETNR